jgi:hypothetical protein
VEFASAETYPFAETVRRMVAGGFLSAASVGFKPLKYMYNEERRGVDIEESELLEWSIVPVPANPECLVQLSAALAPGMLDEFAKSCEQFMEACKGKGQWVVEADLKRAETAVADFLEFKDELKAQLIAIGEAKQGNEKDSPDLRTIADFQPKVQGQVEAAADELEIKNGEIIFEDEADYIFGLDITAVTETVKEATRQALKDQAVRHIKSQIDYARGRIQE